MRQFASIDARHVAKAPVLPGAVASVDPEFQPADPALVFAVGPAFCLREGLLPWRHVGGAVVVLAADPLQFQRHLSRLTAALGPVRMAHARQDLLKRSLLHIAGPFLASKAETKLPEIDSCRNYSALRPQQKRKLAAGLLGFAGAAVLFPGPIIVGLCLLAIIVLTLATALKAAAAVATLGRGKEVAPVLAQDADNTVVFSSIRPIISLLVPLYKEPEIAGHLLQRLAQIDYPKARLDACLILEDNDHVTRAALARTKLPDWVQVITVPAGMIRTKPRALNYAMDFTRGSIIGIYDAEDLPARDQLHAVAAGFAKAPPEVACLQGVLDYFNTDSNWLARCFTLEYAAWFRVLLPGMARLGLAVPLGGTTLFIRKEVIEELGGWDAHNVTEDADLGIRLARRGYKTELISSVTQEEANARFWPWVKQRSRWLKGYAITWAVHMRDPKVLWQELGPKRFFAFQVLFLGTLAQFCLAPVLWSAWLLMLGFGHPLNILPNWAVWAFIGTCLTGEVVNIAVALLGAKRAQKPRLYLWSLTLLAYFPMATLSVIKAFWEVVHNPFYWDKTSHGIDAPPKDSLYVAASNFAASSFNRVTKARLM
ncbi:MAG: glycosyltransferase [Rhodobacteraceae bacterium]|nr:glycosyltransferase [Paracoccaceae bacterium]PHR55164.1 MAG: glycosyl transferase [Robiginitomaculum sp.]